LDFFLLLEIVTTWKTDSTEHKLKPRLFHKSTHLQVYFADFHSQCEPCLITRNSTKFSYVNQYKTPLLFQLFGLSYNMLQSKIKYKAHLVLYTHSNTSNLFDSITDNIYLKTGPLKTFVEVDIFLSVYSYSSSINLFGSIIFNHTITDHMVFS